MKFVLALLVAGTGWAAEPLTFSDVGDEMGLFPAASGLQGHGAAWGDIDNDGRLDLFIGTFHKKGTKPTLLFGQHEGKFVLDEQPAATISGQVTGVVFADFDNDGNLDLYIGSMPKPKAGLAGCTLLRNNGGGEFINVSEGCGACPAEFGGRSVAVLDFDGDGLLDLLIGEDPHIGYNGSTTRATRLFRNLGGFKFEDASRATGLPEVPGLGVAAADLNNDGWPDIFIASSDGGNVLCLNDGHGHFKELAGSRELFAWKDSGGDNMICGVAAADVNRDGLLDLVIGQHYDSPWIKPVPVRLYLNRGIEAGAPRFEDVTDRAGLLPLPLKAPHVELQDMDNDGLVDVVTSMVKFRDGVPHPVIFRQVTSPDDVPRFEAPALAVNDFPDEAERAIKRPATLFSKALAEGRATYMAGGPTGDFNNDGKLDMFLPSWWPEGRSLLLLNETKGGHWLDVTVVGSGRVNRMGVGARVLVYRAGHLGEKGSLLGARDISVGFGYASGQPAIAHFGLGEVTAVDVEVRLPNGQGTILKKAVPCDQGLRLETAQP